MSSIKRFDWTTQGMIETEKGDFVEYTGETAHVDAEDEIYHWRQIADEYRNLKEEYRELHENDKEKLGEIKKTGTKLIYEADLLLEGMQICRLALESIANNGSKVESARAKAALKQLGDLLNPTDDVE
jgi:hypothetical protein